MSYNNYTSSIITGTDKSVNLGAPVPVTTLPPRGSAYLYIYPREALRGNYNNRNKLLGYSQSPSIKRAYNLTLVLATSKNNSKRFSYHISKVDL